MDKQIDEPLGEWEALKRGDETSTVAHFVGGYEHQSGVTVLVWAGVEDEDGIRVIETSSDDYVYGTHEYIIEVKHGHALTRQMFARDESEAWKKANSVMMSNNDQIEARLLDVKTKLREELNSAELAFEEAEEKLRENSDVRDRDVEFRETLRRIRDCLQALSMQALDAKQSISYISTGGLMESDEFHQNIKPGNDDAFYGAHAANREMNREVRWPLKLDEWEKEKGEMVNRRGDYDPVTAEGTVKYTKRLSSGATVTLVIDERGMSPM